MAAAAKTCRLSRTNVKSGADATIFFKFSFSYRTRTATNRSGCGMPAGCNSNALTALKIAVFAPIPSASVRTATIVNPGFFASTRSPYFASAHSLPTLHLRNGYDLVLALLGHFAGHRVFADHPSVF